MRFCYHALILLFLSTFTLNALANDEAEEPYYDPRYAEIDPYESFNRSMFVLNDNLDEYLATPLAKFYRFVTPGFVDKGVTNFFGNLNDVETFVNSLLQAKFHNAVVSLNRVIYNTVFGIGGLFDVATSFGLEASDEDFGQTLGYWGYEESTYLVLPVLGPSTVRDFSGQIVDYVADPVDYLVEFSTEESIALKAVDLIDTRADLLAANNLLFKEDRYAFFRSAYLQNRNFLIKDGEVEDPFADDEDFDYEDF
jgi:phospholipid-binding lipoprotein MlaA